MAYAPNYYPCVEPIRWSSSTIDISKVTNGITEKSTLGTAGKGLAFDNALCIKKEIIGQRNGNLQKLESRSKESTSAFHMHMHREKRDSTSYTRSC